MTTRIVVPGIHVLAQSAVAVSHTGNTSETTLATVTVPAGAMGGNGLVRITTWWSMTNDGSNKTTLIRWNGTGGTAILNSTFASSAFRVDQRIVANRDSTSSQFIQQAGGTGGWGTGTAAFTSDAVNTASAVDIVMRGQLADGTDTITLEAYLVELMHRS